MSITEAEYKGATVAACETIWLKRILKDLGVPLTDPIRIFCDNMSNIYLTRNPVFHARTKHIEVHYHFIRERVQAGDIDLQHISTNLQVADIFTKALGVDKLGRFAIGPWPHDIRVAELEGEYCERHAYHMQRCVNTQHDVNRTEHEIGKPNNPVRRVRTSEARFRRPNRK